MAKPQSIYRSEVIIYVCLAAGALVSLIDRWMGSIGTGEFVSGILVNGLLCMIPYKLGRRSNPSRYVYVVLFIASIFFMLGGVGRGMPRLDLVLSVIAIPAQIYVCWMLFQPEASRWFAGDAGRAESPWYSTDVRRDPE